MNAVSRIHHALIRADATGLTDGQLLEQYARDRDGAAFAALVARHGPMVLGVCRRVIGDPHDADDAFQATFLVLARRADAVRPRDRVGNFLYGVAVRTAREARSARLRRLARERPTDQLPEHGTDAPADFDLRTVIDEELARLPAPLREVVLACDLEGASQRTAARQLGLPVGTLTTRLAQARALLAERLRWRGLAALGPVAVSAALADAAVALASGGTVPPTVSALVTGATRTMTLTKLVAATVGLLVATVGVVAAWPSHAPAEARKPVAVVRPAPVPKPTGEGVLLVTTFDKDRPAELFKPDGTLIRALNVGDETHYHKPRLSPDGKRWLAIRLGPIPQGNDKPWTPNHLHVFDLDSKDGAPVAVLPDLYYPGAAWAADGKVYVSQIDPEKVDEKPKNDDPLPLVSWVFDPKTKAKTPLKLPPGHHIMDCSPDGKTLLTTVPTFGQFLPHPDQTYLVPIATLTPKLLTKKRFNGLRFSPDGTRVLGNRLATSADGNPTPELVIVKVADGLETVLALPKESAGGVHYVCWSPDGKRIAHMWWEEVPPPPGTPPPVGNTRPLAARVSVVDADGSNAKTIIRREWNQTVYGLDWR